MILLIFHKNLGTSIECCKLISHILCCCHYKCLSIRNQPSNLLSYKHKRASTALQLGCVVGCARARNRYGSSDRYSYSSGKLYIYICEIITVEVDI